MKLGDKVVFVDDQDIEGPLPVPMPKVGSVYAIRSFGVCGNRKELYLRLLGVACDFMPDGTERGLWAWRFRKLDEMQRRVETKTLLQEHRDSGDFPLSSIMDSIGFAFNPAKGNQSL